MSSKKNSSTGIMQEQSGSSSVMISAKAIAAAQQARRNRMFVLSCIAGCAIVSATLFMLSGSQSSKGEKLATKIVEQNTDQAFFNEWPAQAAEAGAPFQSRIPFANTKLHTHAESTQVSKASQHSLLSFAAASKKISIGTLEHINTDLIGLHSVPFHPTTTTANDEPKGLLAAVEEPAQTDLARTLPLKKNMQWFVGIGFNPQLSNYSISKNDNSLYNSTGRVNYADLYINNLHNQSKVYSYNASLKGGFIYRNKWMVQGSVGYQSFRYLNKPTGPVAAEPVSMVSNNTLAANSYHYMNYGVEASRLFDFKNFDLKTGVGFSASRLVAANTVVANGHNMFSFMKRHHGTPLNKWMYTPSIHVGIVKNLSNGVSMQASPNLYYNLNSMFNRNYLVTQKPYGVGLDLSLLIRIN